METREEFWVSQHFCFSDFFGIFSWVSRVQATTVVGIERVFTKNLSRQRCPSLSCIFVQLFSLDSLGSESCGVDKMARRQPKREHSKEYGRDESFFSKHQPDILLHYPQPTPTKQYETQKAAPLRAQRTAYTPRARRYHARF